MTIRDNPVFWRGVDFFSSLFGVKQEESTGGNIVRIFETGGGDPAMSGDPLVLSVTSYPEEKTYDLGLNVKMARRRMR